ncbi:MAG: hypothetical protein IJH83_04175 [Coriobacteriales bacterium]|nr:hypothetical protein [Coriobacteriales bacterium]
MLEGIEPIAICDEGRRSVYMVTHAQLRELRERGELANLGDDAVVILDDRAARDPNMQIRDSIRIMTPQLRREIARIMLDYDASHPVEPAWQRTADSIEREWRLHNILYRLGIQRARTRDCDLNNSDEGRTAAAFLMGWVAKKLREWRASAH